MLIQIIFIICSDEAVCLQNFDFINIKILLFGQRFCISESHSRSWASFLKISIHEYAILGAHTHSNPFLSIQINKEIIFCCPGINFQCLLSSECEYEHLAFSCFAGLDTVN